MLSNWEIDVNLLCLRSTSIDHVIPSPGELLYNRKLVNARKEEIWDRLLHRQLTQKKQHDKHAQDNWFKYKTKKLVPAVVRQVYCQLRSYIIETLTEQGPSQKP